MNNGHYNKVTQVTGGTVHFTASRAYTGSNGIVTSVTQSTGAGFIVSGALNVASKITINGTDVLAKTFNTGSFYPIAVEKVVAHATDYIFVFNS